VSGSKRWETMLQLTINVIMLKTVILYGCETWSLTQKREKHRLGVHEGKLW